MKISNECEIGSFSLGEEHDNFCEHCGNIPMFEITWSNGCTWWCLDCAEYAHEDFVLTPEFYEELMATLKDAEINYHVKELRRLGYLPREEVIK